MAARPYGEAWATAEVRGFTTSLRGGSPVGHPEGESLGFVWSSPLSPAGRRASVLEGFTNQGRHVLPYGAPVNSLGAN